MDKPTTDLWKELKDRWLDGANKHNKYKDIVKKRAKLQNRFLKPKQ